MIDYDAEINRIECEHANSQPLPLICAYENLASRLRKERDRFKAERDDLQHRLDHPVMTDDVDELAKLAWKAEHHYLCRDEDDTTWEDMDAWTAYGYYLMAEAVRDAVIRAREDLNHE